jgi:hypothetical protein
MTLASRSGRAKTSQDAAAEDGSGIYPTQQIDDAVNEIASDPTYSGAAPPCAQRRAFAKIPVSLKRWRPGMAATSEVEPACMRARRQAARPPHGDMQ